MDIHTFIVVSNTLVERMEVLNPIEVYGISYQYAGTKDLAVKDITFHVKSNEIVGLLGHNGSGKTTIMNCIAGLFQPVQEKVLLSGTQISDLCKPKPVGYVPADPILYNMLTVQEYIVFIGKLHHLSTAQIHTISEPLLDMLKLKDNRHKLIKHLSHGMKQKVSMITGLLHQPPALVLDEPMTGFDAQSTKEMKDFLVHLVRTNHGAGILLSSHRLDIVESICDRIVVIRQGQLIFTGSVQELKHSAQHGNSLEEAFLSITSENGGN